MIGGGYYNLGIGSVNINATKETILAPFNLESGNVFYSFSEWVISSLAKLSSPSILPPGPSYSLAWSPDGKKLVTGCNTSPYLTLYEFIDGELIKQAYSESVGSVIYDFSWSPDGQYLALAMSNAPFIVWFKYADGQLIRLPSPDVLPTLIGYCVSWSPDGQYLAFGGWGGHWYKNENDRLIKQTSLPDVQGYIYSCSWSHDGRFLVFGTDTSGYIKIFELSDGLLNRIEDPDVIPTGTVRDVSWSPSDRFLAVAHDVSPFLTWYAFAGQKLTKLKNPDTLPQRASYSLSWSPNEFFLAVGTSGVISEIWYRLKQNDLEILNRQVPANGLGVAEGCEWHPSGLYLSYIHRNTPYLTMYILTGENGDFLYDQNPPESNMSITDVSRIYIPLKNAVEGDNVEVYSIPILKQ